MASDELNGNSRAEYESIVDGVTADCEVAAGQEFTDVHCSEVSIVQVMQSSYLDYSMSVIVSRALPDVRDGLKPVQRRILYAMFREGLLHNRPFDKCAGVIGEVLKNYHPHGDSSVYDALVRLAQSWVMRYPLVQPQGNFGSVDGDSAAAYRYTECRLAKFAEEILRDLDEETVNFVQNYKESTVEPDVLPCALPNLLLNGSTGIAVGMATNIPPHNSREIIDGALALIDDPHLSHDDLAKIVRGPDFPTGGEIIGYEGIRKYITGGRGIVRMRGKVTTEELKTGREQIVISELPYAVNRAGLVEKIAELVTAKTLDEVSEIRDESDENTRIVLELKRGEPSRVAINKLFLHTPLESSFGVILLALDGKRPKQMPLKEMLELFIEHRRDVVTRRTQFRLHKAAARAHLLEGFRIALDHMDDFVRLIRAADSRDLAKNELMARYPLDGDQADAILEMRLYQLTALERVKIDGEYEELLLHIANYEAILADSAILMGIIRKELEELKDVYGDARKTQILPAEGEFCIEDVIPNECCVITVTKEGFIKRTAADSYNTQRRGGKGVIGAGQRESDSVEHLFSASTHDYIIFAMDNGRIYVQKVYDIPEATRTSKGRSLVNLLQMQEGERVAAMLCAKSFDSDQNIVMCTRLGVVKKTAIRDYRNYRKDGIIGIKIDDGDCLIAAHLTSGSDELMIVTEMAMSVKFPESDLRVQGRATRGVRGITLRPGDEVKMLAVVDNEASLLLATENGLGKRSKYEDYRTQHRGGVGVIAMRTKAPICAALNVRDGDEIMLLTRKGQAVRTPVSDIRIIGRTTQGVRLINLSDGDRLAGISPVLDSGE
ncbi:MAG: DNA gyrase subunit A [Puniceicoccales bacterium]|jgi:DNA gyrase subunit A|nr:DNA gyrase subunit A [Puniceicoccales bacterium]